MATVYAFVYGKPAKEMTAWMQARSPCGKTRPAETNTHAWGTGGH